MALSDVSRMITLFQRLCHFAEEFTQEYHRPLVDALAQLFQEDLAEGEEIPDVTTMLNSLVRRLRRTLERLVLSETELIIAVKENSEFTTLRERLTLKLREVFSLARSETRTHFTREKADRAGFPARIAVNSSELDRQTKVVSLKLRKPDFELGESVIPNSITTAESILAIYEPAVEELRDGQSKAMRRRARIHGRQVAKNQEMSDFKLTYSLFVNLVRASFRLAGKEELAKRLTLNQPNRRSVATPVNDTAPENTPDEDPDGDPDGDPEDPG